MKKFHGLNQSLESVANDKRIMKETALAKQCCAQHNPAIINQNTFYTRIEL